MPFALFIVAIRDDEKVFLEDVRGLALLAHHIGIMLDDLKSLLGIVIIFVTQLFVAGKPPRSSH